MGCLLVGIPHVLETQVVVQILPVRATTDGTLARYGGWLASHASWEHDDTAASLGHHAPQPVSYSPAGQGAGESLGLAAPLPYEGLGVAEASDFATAPYTSLKVYQRSRYSYRSSLVTLVVAVAAVSAIDDVPSSRQKKPTLLVWVHYTDEYPGFVQPLLVVKMYVMFRLRLLNKQVVSHQFLCNSLPHDAVLAQFGG